MIGLIVVIVLVVLVVLVGLYLVGSYKLVSLRNRIENAWAQIDVQLGAATTSSPTWSRRSRAMPRTRETLDAVITARNAGMNAQERTTRPRPRTRSPAPSSRSSP